MRIAKTTKATPNKRAYKDYAKAPFLVAYRKYGAIWRAARSVGISRDAVHDWRRNDQNFAQAFNEARNDTTELLEASAVRQALRGHTALLIFLLKSRKPEMYSERSHHQIRNGKEMEQINHAVSAVATVVRQRVPDNCATCCAPLGIRSLLAEELGLLAKKAMTTPL